MSITSVLSLPSLLLSTAALAGCATTTTALERDDAPRASIRLDLLPHADASRTFPSVIAARLPTADRLASQIRFELGDRAAVGVRLCVAATGSVESITVLRSSTLPTFDDSVIADAAHWQFEAFPGPATLRSCEDAIVTYQPRS